MSNMVLRDASASKNYSHRNNDEDHDDEPHQYRWRKKIITVNAPNLIKLIIIKFQ